MKFKMNFEGVKDVKVDKLEISSNEEEIKINKSLDEQIKDLFKNEIFWIALPIIFSIIYFAIDGYYKIFMGRNYNLPSEYFSIPLSEVFYYLLLLFVIPIFLLCMKALFKPLELQNLEIINIIMLEIIIFIFIYKKILYEIEKNLENNNIFIIFETIYIALIFFSVSCIFSKKIKVYFFNLLLWVIFFYFTLNNCYINITFSITIIILILLSLKFEKIQEIIVSITAVLYFIVLLFLIFCVEKNEYEIFYKDSNPKVVITTYENKYLIMDCDIDDVKKELAIYTKKYEFIDIDEAKEISFMNFEEIYRIGINSPLKTFKISEIVKNNIKKIVNCSKDTNKQIKKIIFFYNT